MLTDDFADNKAYIARQTFHLNQCLLSSGRWTVLLDIFYIYTPNQMTTKINMNRQL